MTAQQLAWFRDSYQTGQRVAIEGFAGTAKNQLQMLRGRFKLLINSESGRDISAFSAKHGQDEVLFMHGTILHLDKVEETHHGAIRIWAHET